MLNYVYIDRNINILPEHVSINYKLLTNNKQWMNDSLKKESSTIQQYNKNKLQK